MLELLLVVIIAAIGMLVIGRAFTSTTTGTEKTAAKATQAAKKEKAKISLPKEKVQAQAAAAAPAAPQSPSNHNGAKSSPKNKKVSLTKKQLAARAAEEAEMDRLINQSGVSVSGMSTDKKKVISLDSLIKKDDHSTKKTEAVEISTKKRLIEAEEGFAIVEKQLIKKTTSNKAQKAARQKKEEQSKDKNLNSFFKSQDAKAKGAKGAWKGKDGDKDDEEKEKKPTGTVTMRKKITSDAKDMWGERQYE